MNRIDPVELLKRLRVLEQKLEFEGAYVRANTVFCAIQFVLQTMGDEVALEYIKDQMRQLRPHVDNDAWDAITGGKK